MKSLIILVSLIGLIYGRSFIDSDVTLSSDEMIDAINSLGTTWKAGKNFEDQLDIKKLVGVKLEKSGLYLPKRYHRIIGDLPATFDARQAWPNCSSIRLIRDQSDCGSCWAFGSVEAMSDRICIASKGSIQVDLSAEDPLSCCSYCGYGCGGGWPARAYAYYEESGIVSGGLYNGTGCKPYSIAPDERDPSTPECTKECVSGYDKTYKEDKHFGKPAYQVEGVEQTMQEILTNGPVTGIFDVYYDFQYYKSGVYQQTSQQLVGRHAIKIIGWGTEDGVDYWLIANSWGDSWGLNGYFKFKRGTNECQIESDIVGGLPKL